MCGWKFVASLMTIALCAGVAVYWDSAIQPEMMSQQALRQVEFHTDGSGDRAAAERRLLSWGQHLPAEIAAGAVALALVLLIWSDAGTARRRPAPAIHVSAKEEQT
jgi:hypothetical protein